MVEVVTKMKRISKKYRLLTVLVIVIIAAAGSFYIISSHKKTPDSPKQPLTQTPSPTQPGVTITTTESTTPKQADNTNTSTPVASKTELEAPSGIFVSNHHPNLDGNPAPNSLNSTCKTSSGATCEIQFTKDGVTKTLGPNLAGSDGYISWDWKLQDLGLTQGTWTITAVSRLAGQVKSTTDSINLEVGE